MTVRILAVCGNGQGSSMIMKMKVDQFLTQSNIDHTVNSCAVGEYKSELSGADIIIASTHIAGEITVTGNKYVVGVRNMLSPADFGPKLLEVYSAAIFLIPICISFDTAEKRRYATYLILNRRFSFEF